MQANTKYTSPLRGEGERCWRPILRKIALLISLASIPAIANDQPDAELLEFLGDYEIEVEGEWVNPVSLDIEEPGAEMAQDTTPLQRGKTHE